MTKFSIVLPVYKVEKYIRKCLESIEAQTFKDFEAICIDDCGGDSSVGIIEEFLKKDKRFKLISHEHNKGLSAARNTGIENAKGEYILFIDSDDWVEPELLERVYNAFKQFKTDSIWFNAFVHHQKIGQTDFLVNNLSPSSQIKLTPKNLNKFSTYAWNKAFRRSKLKELNLKFTEGLYFEDSDFYYKIFASITEIYFITQPLYHYQLREESIVTGSKDVEKKFEDLFQIVINMYIYYKEHSLFEQYKELILQFFADSIISVKVKKRRKLIINLAKNTLKEIDFPNSYRDLNKNP